MNNEERLERITEILEEAEHPTKAFRHIEECYAQALSEKDAQIQQLKRQVQSAMNIREAELECSNKEIQQLKEEVNELKMDNMTHEYNQAEAERTWPQFKEQIEQEAIEKSKGGATVQQIAEAFEAGAKAKEESGESISGDWGGSSCTWYDDTKYTEAKSEYLKQLEQ